MCNPVTVTQCLFASVSSFNDKYLCCKIIIISYKIIEKFCQLSHHYDELTNTHDTNEKKFWGVLVWEDSVYVWVDPWWRVIAKQSCLGCDGQKVEQRNKFTGWGAVRSSQGHIPMTHSIDWKMCFTHPKLTSLTFINA